MSVNAWTGRIWIGGMYPSGVFRSEHGQDRVYCDRCGQPLMSNEVFELDATSADHAWRPQTEPLTWRGRWRLIRHPAYRRARRALQEFDAAMMADPCIQGDFERSTALLIELRRARIKPKI